MTDSLVTVYVPCYNYAHYLEEAVESVLKQTYSEWELIIIDDGSQDDTGEIAKRYQKSNPDQIRVLTHPKPLGLLVSANEALRAAKGRYIMRLDADDYLDENALWILAGYLDKYPEIALVFPNYIYVDHKGNCLGVEQRKRVGVEAKVLDLPAHGACSLVRKRVLKSVGGYDEKFDRQDGYDLWLKIVNRYRVANVETPLFYYRQHDESLTGDNARLLEVREKIKRVHSNRENLTVAPRVLAVVGAKNTYPQLPNIVLTEFAGRSLLDYTLETVCEVEAIKSILVSTDDPKVVSFCQKNYPEIIPRLRSPDLSAAHIGIPKLIYDAVQFMEGRDFYPDIIVWLGVNCPLREPADIYEAINTLLVYDVDSVISVYEDYELHYLHGMYGLEELNAAMHRQVRLEREALFVDNGAVRAVWRDHIADLGTSGQRVGHITLPRYRSFQIKTPQDAWLLEQLLDYKNKQKDNLPEKWGEIRNKDKQ